MVNCYQFCQHNVAFYEILRRCIVASVLVTPPFARLARRVAVHYSKPAAQGGAWVDGRGLHSSTFQLNLSRLLSQTPPIDPLYPKKRAYVEPRSGRV